MSFAENATDEGGKGRGAEVADEARGAERGRAAARGKKVANANHTWRNSSSSKGWKTTFKKISEDILVEVGTMEAYVLCLTDEVSIVGNLAKKACDQEGRRKLVFTKQRKDIWCQVWRNMRSVVQN